MKATAQVSQMQIAESERPFSLALYLLIVIVLSWRDFTRYITKSIFLGKQLWETERMQSYQYFTEEEFRAAIARVDLEIFELRTLTMNEEKWRYRVAIESPKFNFPDEHILILAQQLLASHPPA